MKPCHAQSEIIIEDKAGKKQKKEAIEKVENDGDKDDEKTLKNGKIKLINKR